MGPVATMPPMPAWLSRPSLLALLTLALTAAQVSAQTGNTHRDPDSWKDPARIVQLFQITRGSHVAAMGSGSLALLPALSKAAGKTGKVYLVDNDPAIVEAVRTRIAAKKLANVTAILSQGDRLELPTRVGTVVMVNVLHHLEDRGKFLEQVKTSLAPNGIVVVIDYYKRRMKVGPPVKDRVASSTALREASRQGLRLIRRHRVLPNQYFFVFGLSRKQA